MARKRTTATTQALYLHSVDKELMWQLRAAAALEERTMRDFVISILKKAVEESLKNQAA